MRGKILLTEQDSRSWVFRYTIIFHGLCSAISRVDSSVCYEYFIATGTQAQHPSCGHSSTSQAVLWINVRKTSCISEVSCAGKLQFHCVLGILLAKTESAGSNLLPL